MKKKDAKGKMLERFWICVTNPEVTDKDGNFIPQGYAEISIEILPVGFAKELDAGLGRDSPNQHPILPDPTGRFSFVRIMRNLTDFWIGSLFSLEDDERNLRTISRKKNLLRSLLPWLLSYHALLGILLGWRHCRSSCWSGNPKDHRCCRMI